MRGARQSVHSHSTFRLSRSLLAGLGLVAAAGDIRRSCRAVRAGVGVGVLAGAAVRAGAAELRAVSWNVGCALI